LCRRPDALTIAAMPPPRRPLVLAAACLAAAVAAWSAWVRSEVRQGERLPPGDYEPRPLRDWEVPPAEAAAVRDDALSRARVWLPPASPIARADLARNPGDRDPLDTSKTLPCRFLPSAAGGTTPKFDCVLEGGEIVKVKYGGSAELPAEVAAARLLAALGFASDRMYVFPHVRCFGCPASPFRTYQVLDAARIRELYDRQIDYARWTDFHWVTVERRFRGATIATDEVKGWSFDELDRIDRAAGGASPAEVDALRLLAVFLHHWDNKSENQRLVCLTAPRAGGNGRCPEPFALLQDVGATFGPDKVDLRRWAARPLWSDAATCTVDMDDLPFGGATFRRVRIGEDGRRFLAERIGQLSDTQVRGLFAAARFPEFHGAGHPAADPAAWAEAFRAKVGALADRPPCPPLSRAGAPSPRRPSRPSA
jgi:hypothetical protein